MATLALSVGGALVGGSLFPAGLTFFGTTLSGAAVGQAVGGLAGAAVDALWLAPSLPRQRIEGPRLEELRVTGGDYGSGIPLAYGGSFRGAGTVIWMSPIEEKRKEDSEGGGKGGGPEVETVTFQYRASLALALCAGPIAGLRRLWADGHVIWEHGRERPTGADSLTVHLGDEEQLPDPLIEAQEGAGLVPAFRGLAYLVIERLRLDLHGNRLPNLVAEVYLPPSRVRLADAVADLCRRAGVEPVNTTGLEARPLNGYVVPRVMSAREALEPLQRAYFFDARETEAGLVCRPMARTILHDVEADDLGAGPEGRPAPRLPVTRADALSLPRAIAVQYADAAREGQSGLQQARRQQSGSHVETELQLPVTLHAGQAREVAERTLALAWQQRERGELALPSAWRRIAAGDLLRVPQPGPEGERRRVLRVLETARPASGELQLSVVSDAAAGDGGYHLPRRPGAIAPVPSSPFPRPPSATRLLLLDLPALREEDDEAGLYVAMAPETPARPWPGALLYRVIDGDLVELLEQAAPAAIGETAGTLGPGPATHWDRAAELLVQLDDPAGLFESRSDAAVLAGQNALLVGQEILQFGQAEALGAGLWRLTRLLRGRLGTEAAITGHGAAETVVQLSADGLRRLPLPLGALGQTRDYRAVTFGTDPDLPPTHAFAGAGRALRPWSPAHLRAQRAESGDWQVSWRRRDRLDRGWRDGVDTALSEASESYQVQVLDGAAVVRQAAVAAATGWAYTAAMQTSDWGGPQDSLALRVRQMSAAVGGGDWAEGAFAAPGFSPDLWLDAGDIGSEHLRVDGADLLAEAWPAKTGGHEFLQPTGSLQPLYSADAANGRPALWFDGSGPRMAAGASLLGLLNGAPGCTAFGVVRYGATNAVHYWLMVSAAGDNTMRFGAAGHSGGQYRSSHKRLDSETSANLTPGTRNASAFVIQEITADPGADASSLWADGVLQGSGAPFTSTGPYEAADSQEIALGRTAGGATFAMHGWVAEILVWRRVLDAEERAAVRAYLAGKYGIALP